MAVVQSDFPDVPVWVKNNNEANWSLYFDSKEYNYPAGEAVRVPAEVAWFHFAFDTREGKNYRDFEGGKDNRGTPWYESRLMAYGALQMPHVRQEFKNFQFKVSQSPRKIAAVDFDKIK